jgi:hypothetical protein
MEQAKSNANDQQTINMLILIMLKADRMQASNCLPCPRVLQGRIQQAQDYVARLNPCTWPCNRLAFASLYPVPGRGSKIIIGVCKSPRQVHTIFGSVPADPLNKSRPVSYSAGPYGLQYRLYIGQAY